jgi:membrane dipeptidase
VHDHPRNLDDARIKALAAKGGTIQINSYNDYLIAVPPNPARTKVSGPLFARLDNLAGLTAGEAARTVRETVAAIKVLDVRYPQPRASLDDFMKHVTHALDLVGPDHVGVGCDWDGGGGVEGMEDVASLPRVTERLVNLGYTETQLAGFWGGNALRVLKAAHDARKT